MAIIEENKMNSRRVMIALVRLECQALDNNNTELAKYYQDAQEWLEHFISKLIAAS